MAVRPPLPPVAWVRELLGSDPTPQAVVNPTCLSDRECLEVFAGRAGLTIACRKVGLHCDTPMEAFPSKGIYVKEHDLSFAHHQMEDTSANTDYTDKETSVLTPTVVLPCGRNFRNRTE